VEEKGGATGSDASRIAFSPRLRLASNSLIGLEKITRDADAKVPHLVLLLAARDDSTIATSVVGISRGTTIAVSNAPPRVYDFVGLACAGLQTAVRRSALHRSAASR